MTERELDEILTFHWPLVIRRVMDDGSDQWLMRFVRSIARRGKRPEWSPSGKQERVMRRLVSDLGAPAEPELELIER